MPAICQRLSLAFLDVGTPDDLGRAIERFGSHPT